LLKAGPARKGFLPREKFEELLDHIPVNLKPLIVFVDSCGVCLGEAEQIDWSQVDLNAALIRLEEEQTKSREARTAPLPDVRVKMLRQTEPKVGRVFDATNLRKS
jgi:integrase